MSRLSAEKLLKPAVCLYLFLTESFNPGVYLQGVKLRRRHVNTEAESGLRCSGFLFAADWRDASVVASTFVQ